MSGEFLDTNVLAYAFVDDPRKQRARELLDQGCVISVQVLNEFANVARRRLGMSWDEIDVALTAIREFCPIVVPMTIDVHEKSLAIARRHRLHIFDALIVATALQAECATLWSEDMHDGLLIDGRLRITNPFHA